jgi:hypothetical protein
MDMNVTGRHFVIVRNSDDEVVHTHEFVDIGGVEPLADDELLSAAVSAALRAHPDHGDGLTPYISSGKEVERLRTESMAPLQPSSPRRSSG